jgi:hypothetical protein
MAKRLRILLFPSTVLELKCPSCQGRILLSDIASGFIATRRLSDNRFACRGCGTRLQVPTAYLWRLDATCQLIALAITVGLAVHPWYIFLVVWQVLHLLVVSFGSPYRVLILPPRLTIYDPHPNLSLDLWKKGR